MKKISVLTLTAAMLAAPAAFAVDMSPYAAIRGSWAQFKTTAESTFAGVTEKMFVKDQYPWGIRASGGLETPLNEWRGRWRAEIELGANETIRDDTIKISTPRDTTVFKVASRTAFTNLYYDLNTGTRFSPYIGGGIGMSYLKRTLDWASGGVSAADSNSGYHFAYNLGAGVSYDVSKNTRLELGYRFTDLGRISESVDMMSGSTVIGTLYPRGHFTMQEILLGARYTF